MHARKEMSKLPICKCSATSVIFISIENVSKALLFHTKSLSVLSVGVLYPLIIICRQILIHNYIEDILQQLFRPRPGVGPLKWHVSIRRHRVVFSTQRPHIRNRYITACLARGFRSECFSLRTLTCFGFWFYTHCCVGSDLTWMFPPDRD